jgi:glutathione S-transferase
MGLFSKKRSNKSETMHLRGFPADPGTNKCLLMAAEKNIRLETELLDVTAGACDGPEYRRLSPFGKLPCLKEGEFLTSGAHAILAYMDVRGQGSTLNPKKASILGEQNYLIDIAQRFIDPSVCVLMQSLFPVEGDKSADIGAGEVDSARAELGRVMDCAEALLGDGRHYLVGEYSFADIHWTAGLHLCVMAGQKDLLDGRSALQDWCGRVQERINKVSGKRTYDYLASLDEIREKRLKSVA